MSPILFVQKVQEDLQKHQLQLVLLAKPDLEGGNLGGFHYKFGIEIAAQYPGWLAVLAHEYGHFEQMLEEHPDWGASAYVFMEWIRHEVELSADQVLDLTRSLQRLERDAEVRALSYIKEFNLGDVNDYTRRANRYVLSFELARRHRVWPHISDEFLPLFSKKLVSIASIGNHRTLARFRPLHTK